MDRKRKAVGVLIAILFAAAVVAEAKAETPYYAFPPFWPLIAIGALVGVPPPGTPAARACCYYEPPPPCYCAPPGPPYYRPPPGYAPAFCRPGYCPGY